MGRAAPNPWYNQVARLKNDPAPLDDRLIRLACDILEPQDEEVAGEADRVSASLETFTRMFWHILEPANPLQWGWHLGCISAHLEAMTFGEISRLIINMPPRHAKSLMVCVFWFCWVWTRNPESRWLFSSYSDSLSTRDSGKCQDIILHPEYQRLFSTRFRMRPGQRAMSKFSNDRTGYRIATSVMGRGMGEGGDYVVVDDPHKPTEVYSDILRERVNDWWSGTMSTRGNDPKTVRKVIVMQRLHERDLSGYALAADLDYEHLCLPAHYEPKRYFFPTVDRPKPTKRTRDQIIPTSLQRSKPELLDPRTKEGQLLWPERFGEKEIAALKKELQTGSAGQLEQRPAPAEGELFKKSTFRYFVEEVVTLQTLTGERAVECYTLLPTTGDKPVHIPKEDCRIFGVADTALTQESTSSFTAATFFASCPVVYQHRLVARFLLILDSVREKLLVPDQYPFLRAVQSRYPDSVFLAIEPKATGLGLIQTAIADGRPFKKLKTQGDKVKRVASVLQLYNEGIVYHRANMPNLTDFEDELLTFPSGQYDDMTDTVGYGGQLFVEDKILTMVSERELLTSDGVTDSRGEVYEIGGVPVFFPDEEDAPGWD
jgi:predicted phage terminase large subunit-like protein